MLLDNYYSMFLYMMYLGMANIGSSQYAGISDVSYTATDGKRYDFFGGVAGAVIMHKAPYNGVVSQFIETTVSSTAYHCPLLIIGSGTTPVQRSDYMIEKEIVDGVSVVSSGVVLDERTKSVNYVKTMRNNGESDITVNEVGFAVSAVINTGTTRRHVLVYREVLDTPIVAAPGETFTVSYAYKP